VNPGLIHSEPPFSLLPEVMVEPRIEAQPGNVHSISPVGVNVYFPARHFPDYPHLLAREITLKTAAIATRGAVSSLWFRGYPLRQLPAEALTELVFRLCGHFNLRQASGSSRGIDLGPEHCARDNLALLRGLGFDVVRLLVDATFAGPDHSTNQCQRALVTIGDFASFRLRSTLLYGEDTSGTFLARVLATLMLARAEEIELVQCLPRAASAEALAACRKLFAESARQLEEQGYQLFNDHCFKGPSHPDRVLLASRRLAYGPWGFYCSDITLWVGLGLSADGLVDGYLYRNTGNPEDYRQRLEHRRIPAISWSATPVGDQPLYQLIQELFCYHRAPALAPAVQHRLLALGWVEQSAQQLTLTRDGIYNLHHLFLAIIGGDK